MKPLYTLSERQGWHIGERRMVGYTIHCPSDGSGYKTRVMLEAEAFGGKWSHRRQGYDISRRGCHKFQEAVAKLEREPTKMKKFDLNGNKVEVPQVPGLTVVNGQMGPGAYDYLSYKDWEIGTFEQEARGFYRRGFWVSNPDEGILFDLKPFKKVEDAVAYIDAHV